MQIKNKKVFELKIIAKKRGLKRYSKLNKQGLINLILKEEIEIIKKDLTKNRETKYGDIKYGNYIICPDINEDGEIISWSLNTESKDIYHWLKGLIHIYGEHYGIFKNIDSLCIKLIELKGE